MSKLIKVNEEIYSLIKGLEGETFNDKLNGILRVYQNRTSIPLVNQNDQNGIPLVNSEVNGIPPVYLEIKANMEVMITGLKEILKAVTKETKTITAITTLSPKMTISKPSNTEKPKPSNPQIQSKPIKSWKDYNMPVQTITGKPQIQTNEFDESELDFLNKYKASKPKIQALMKLNGSKQFGSEKLNLMLNSISPLNGLPRPSILPQILPAGLPAVYR